MATKATQLTIRQQTRAALAVTCIAVYAFIQLKDVFAEEYNEQRKALMMGNGLSGEECDDILKRPFEEVFAAENSSEV